MAIGKTLTWIVLTGALVLGWAGCNNKNPDKKDIEQETKLYTGWFGGCAPN
ncbi:MAG: hypothetical protein Q8N63_01075 [Nanoarchaeota archaeon]|nr:hypothetical protein [Nanoarchaeota archaeon]